MFGAGSTIILRHAAKGRADLGNEPGSAKAKRCGLRTWCGRAVMGQPGCATTTTRVATASHRRGRNAGSFPEEAAEDKSRGQKRLGGGSVWIVARTADKDWPLWAWSMMPSNRQDEHPDDELLRESDGRNASSRAEVIRCQLETAESPSLSPSPPLLWST